MKWSWLVWVGGVCLAQSVVAGESFTVDEQNPCVYRSAEDTFFDKTYDFVNTQFCQPALWFDNFFADERVTDDARAGTYVRWYNDFAQIENQGFDYRTRLNAKVRLPFAERRLRLVFENTAEEALSDLFPKSTSDARNTLGLGYDFLSKERSSFTVRVNLRPGIAARYRYTYPLDELTTLSFRQSVYQNKDTTGGVTSFDLDRRVSDEVALRFNVYGKMESEFDGIEGGAGMVLYQYLNEKQALSYELSSVGRNQPGHYISNSHVAVRFRHNIWRNWFFYEVIPSVDWPKEENQERYREAALTLRLEVLFNNL